MTNALTPDMISAIVLAPRRLGGPIGHTVSAATKARLVGAGLIGNGHGLTEAGVMAAFRHSASIDDLFAVAVGA
jgi:hypothetical protein